MDNWPKHLLQWGVLAAVIGFAAGVIPSATKADPEAYCPMGGLQALATYLANDSLPCIQFQKVPERVFALQKRRYAAGGDSFERSICRNRQMQQYTKLFEFFCSQILIAGHTAAQSQHIAIFLIAMQIFLNDFGFKPPEKILAMLFHDRTGSGIAGGT